MSDVVGTLEQSLGGTANLPTENDPGTEAVVKFI